MLHFTLSFFPLASAGPPYRQNHRALQIQGIIVCSANLLNANADPPLQYFRLDQDALQSDGDATDLYHLPLSLLFLLLPPPASVSRHGFISLHACPQMLIVTLSCELPPSTRHLRVDVCCRSSPCLRKKMPEKEKNIKWYPRTYSVPSVYQSSSALRELLRLRSQPGLYPFPVFPFFFPLYRGQPWKPIHAECGMLAQSIATFSAPHIHLLAGRFRPQKGNVNPPDKTASCS